MLLAVAAAPAAAASYVQGAARTLSAQQSPQRPQSPQSPQSTLTVSFPSTQSADDLNVVFIDWDDTTSRVVSVTDASGNLYLRAHELASAGLATQAVYYASRIKHAYAGRNAVQVMFDGVIHHGGVLVAEYHGIDPQRPIDHVSGAAGRAETARGGSLITSATEDLLVVGAFTGQALQGPGPGYTQRLLAGGFALLADRLAGPPGAYESAALQSAADWYLMQGIAFRVLRTPPPQAPYPHSQISAGMQWDFSTVVSHRKAVGSDLWPTTWAADGNLYAAWGDGGGFNGTERNKATGRASLGFARISGFPQTGNTASIAGQNVWGQAPAFAEHQASFGGKVDDLIAIHGVLYAQGGLWTRANCNCSDPTVKGEDNPSARTLAWSADLGRTWQIAPWSSANDLGSTLQFGADYAGAFDPAHVYFYYQGDLTQDPTHLYLRRVRIEDLMADPATSGHFEYFAGVDPSGAARWSPMKESAAAVFVDGNVAPGVYATASVVYDAPLGRYLLSTFHGEHAGQIGFFESRAPWGPWDTLAYYDDWGGFNETAGAALGVNFPTKWISPDGKTLWAVFSGINNGADNEFDSFNVARVQLQ
ncbi:MAG TPA: hypothetical protein VMG11_08575 [Steroidobacteraceae bacterium]|nr:hypothetical protein [Steroidobacteraceae bacterium]